MSLTSDEEVYRRYLHGEEKSVDVLIEKYGDALTLYINGYVKDMHEAEDLMIEAFAQVFAKERPIRENGSFRAYLYKTARNLTIWHKKKKKILLLGYEALPFEPQSEMLADTELYRSERNRQLYQALEQLKEEYREVLYLVYFEEMSYRETAIVMRKSEQQITNLVYRGKKSLKTILEQGGFRYADE